MTTKAGIRSRVMIVPWMAPIAAQTSSAAMIATHHGQLWLGWTSWAATIPPIAAT